MDRAGIMTNPEGGAGNKRHSSWPEGVSVLCTASHQRGQNPGAHSKQQSHCTAGTSAATLAPRRQDVQ